MKRKNYKSIAKETLPTKTLKVKNERYVGGEPDIERNNMAELARFERLKKKNPLKAGIIATKNYLNYKKEMKAEGLKPVKPSFFKKK